jgi:hypothetical protein
MEESLQMLSTNPKCPTDPILVQQVRLQLLAENIAQASLQNKEAGIKTPPAFYLKSLQAQLHELKNSVSPDLQSNSKHSRSPSILHSLTIYSDNTPAHSLHSAK